jgi:hypothetical protein
MKKRKFIIATVVAVLGSVFLIAGCSAQPDGTAVPIEPTSLVDYHDGYWVATMDAPGFPFQVTVINDMHVDSKTNRITVYAQSQVRGRVIAPAQVGPGECTQSNGETVCFHPDAVYLNGSGQELMAADGTGTWWVKHSWVLGGEGYDNCELRPAETYDNCFFVEGDLMEDGLTIKIGGLAQDGYEYFNTRMPVLNEDEVTYLVTRFGPTNTDPNAGEIDLTPMVQFEMTLECQEEASALDNVTRSCPSFTP